MVGPPDLSTTAANRPELDTPRLHETMEGPRPGHRRRSLRMVTHSAAETRALAAAMARVARPGDRLALVGTLGAGKTQFAKGFASGLGVAAVVNSPSFTLMAEYEGRLKLFHQDLFRLSGTDEAIAGGLLDERQDTGVTLSEWADRLDEALDPLRLTVHLEPADEDEREVEIAGAGEGAERYLEAAAAWQRQRST